MKQRSKIAFAALVSVSLVLAACGGDDGGSDAPSDTSATSEAPSTDPNEERTASDIGITADTIRIAVAVADLEAVRAAGISIPETLTTQHLVDRWGVFIDKWNAEGGINGRQVELVSVVWDPLNPASFDTLCATTTVDNEVFMLINGTGLASPARTCVMDAGVPVMYGDVVTQAELDTGLMISLAPPAEVIAKAGVEAWISDGSVPAPAKVGVVASNSPAIKAAGQGAAEALTAAGYDVQVIETNALGGDNAATNQEGAAAVGALKANGAVHIFLTTPFTENTGFWNAAAEASMPFTMLDTNSSQCSAFGLSRAPAAAVGSNCVTAYDHSTSEGQGVRDDLAFEAECRAFFDASFSEYYGGTSNPGVPAGQKITDANGTVLISDYAPQECTMANIMYLALTNAGINPTRASFIEAVLGLGEVPLALQAAGIGTFGPGKAYAADQVHTIRIAAADPSTVPDANGTYNGCPAPVNCGIVISEWRPIS
jgi:ABC-type branched-subunit amino acid transport system substrate-binding protein